MRQLILATGLLLTLGAAHAADTALNLSVRDLSPNFVDFYDAASKPLPAPAAPATAPANGAAAPAPAPVESWEDRRWRYFKKAYDFSAQASPEAARSALEAAWPRYAAVMPQIESGFDGIASEPSRLLDSLSKQFVLDKAMNLRVVTYVGAFEGRVWSDVEADIRNIYLPLEVSSEVRTLPAARLFGEAILARAAVWGDSPRNLAELVVGEGVLAQGVATAVPGKSLEQYLKVSSEELAALRARRKAILSAILPKLGDGSPATLAAYRGPQAAEARFAGWLLVEAFAKKKARYSDMIRQKPADLVKASQSTMASINRGK